MNLYTILSFFTKGWEIISVDVALCLTNNHRFWEKALQVKITIYGIGELNASSVQPPQRSF